MQPHDKLLALTATERSELLALPFIQDGARGKLERQDYVAFLTEAYHHVKHTVPLLMACGARIPERLEWLREAMGEYISEETGHQEWILNDIRACGADAEAVRKGRPGLPAEILVSYAYDTIARGNPVGFLGMVLVLEGTSTAVASNAADALRNSLSLPPQAFSYLTSHGALDQEHTRFYATLVNRITDTGDWEALVHGAKVFYQLYGNVFRGLDILRNQNAQPARKCA